MTTSTRPPSKWPGGEIRGVPLFNEANRQRVTELNDREYVEQYAIHHRWLRGEIDAPTHDAGKWS